VPAHVVTNRNVNLDEGGPSQQECVEELLNYWGSMTGKDAEKMVYGRDKAGGNLTQLCKGPLKH